MKKVENSCPTLSKYLVKHCNNRFLHLTFPKNHDPLQIHSTIYPLKTIQQNKNIPEKSKNLSTETYLKRPYYNLTELTEEQSRDRLLSFIEYCRIQEMTIPRSQRLR